MSTTSKKKPQPKRKLKEEEDEEEVYEEEIEHGAIPADVYRPPSKIQRYRDYTEDGEEEEEEEENDYDEEESSSVMIPDQLLDTAQTDPEVTKTMRLAALREENYTRKSGLLEKLPSNNLYDMSLSKQSSVRSRRDVGITNIVELKPSSASNPFSNPEVAKETSNALIQSRPVTASVNPVILVEQVSDATGAQRVVVPRNLSYQPMHQFYQDNLPVFYYAQKKQQEALERIKSTMPPKPVTTTTTTTTTTVQPQRTTLPMGKRATTLQSGVSSNISHNNHNSNRSSVLPLLPLNDPASQRLDQLDYQTGLIVPYLEQIYQYHVLKTQVISSSSTTKIVIPPPYTMQPEHVEWSHNKYFSPYKPCCFQMRCEGMTPQNHHTQPCFPFIQYVPPAVRKYVEQTGTLPQPKPGDSSNDYLELDENGEPIPTPCLRCMMKGILFLTFWLVGEDQPAHKVYCAFNHPVGVPGGYDPSAVVTFSDGRVNCLPQTLRYFAPEQFVPCMREVVSVKRELDGRRHTVKLTVPSYKEVDSVKYWDSSRTRQRRALEADERATAPSSIPPRPPQPEVASISPAIHPITTVTRGPTSAAIVLRSSLLKDHTDPKLSTGAIGPTPAPASAMGDWRDALDNLTAALLAGSANPTHQQKNSNARHPNNNALPEGGDAHIIRSGLLLVPLEEGRLIQNIEPPKDAGQARIELTLRDLSDAYRLAVYWLKSGKMDPAFFSGYERFDLCQGELDKVGLTNLLQHIVCIRINVCLELEERLFSGVGARRPWLFARYMVLPGASSTKTKPDDQEIGKKRRRKTVAASMHVIGDSSQIPASVVATITDMTCPESEQLGTQIVYWRDRHAPILDILCNNKVSTSTSISDPEALVSSRFIEALCTNPLMRGLPIQPFEKLFDALDRPMPPIYDKDIAYLRTKTQLWCPETPISYLRQNIMSTPDSMDARLQRTLLDTVLVDFRKTIEFLSTSTTTPIPHSHWDPCASQGVTDTYFSSGSHSSERMAWVAKTCEHIRKKDPSNEGRLRAMALQQDAEERTKAMERAFYYMDTNQIDNDNSGTTTTTTTAVGKSKNNSMRETTEEASKLRVTNSITRDQLFAKILKTKDGWKARPLGVDPTSNYLIVVAVVYRVNHGLIELERIRSKLSAPEEEEEEEEKKVEEEQDEEDDDEENEQPIPRPKTNEDDERDAYQKFQRQFQKTLRRIYRLAKPRNPDKEDEKLLDTMHRWKRFVLSHMAFAQLMLDAPRCDDAFFLEENLSEGRLSHYTLAYPFSENGWGEETLQNIRHRTRLVDVVHGIGSTGGLPARPSANANAATSTSANSAALAAASSYKVDEGRECDEEAMVASESSDNMWISLLKKIFPKACSDRDFAAKCDEICRKDVRCFHYVLECFFATLLGLYRHCRNPVRFSLAVSLYRLHELVRDHALVPPTPSPPAPVQPHRMKGDGDDATMKVSRWPYRDVMLDIFFANEELVINSIRENVSWQFCGDPSLWMLDANWVRGCSHLARTIFQQEGTLKGLNDALLRCYGSHGFLGGTKSMPESMAMSTGEASAETGPNTHSQSHTHGPNYGHGHSHHAKSSIVTPTTNKPSVYRVTNKNFVKYAWGIFHQISTEAVLGSVIASVSNGQTEPRVYHLSDDAFDVVLHVVEGTKPGDSIQVVWFRLIGVSEPGIETLLSVYELFRRRAHENDIKRLIRGLKPLDFELLSMFFHLLRCHSDQRLIPLDSTTAREQEMSMRHRMCVPPSQATLSAHLTHAIVCSIAACNELKNYIVQRTQTPLFGGFPKLAWDEDKQMYICTSKKTILVGTRNADRRRANSSEKDEEPGYVKRLRQGNTASFYGCYEGVSKLLRLPPGTNGSVLEDDTAAFLEPTDPTIGTAKKSKRRDAGRRENLERSFVEEISKKLKRYSDELVKCGIDPTPHVLYSLDYVKKDAFETLAESQVADLIKYRSDLDTECKKEERRIFKIKTLRPCFEMRVLQAPLCGYIFEKDSNKSKNTSVAATLCRSCACTFDFSLRLSYANGITCGYCDKAERRMLYAPRCFVCRKSRLERTAVGQGVPTVQRETSGVHLKPLVLIDDSSDWMPKVVRVCDQCYCQWMKLESRSMTLLEMLGQLYMPSANRLMRQAQVTPGRKRDRWLPRSRILDSLKPASWPTKTFVDSLNSALAKHEDKLAVKHEASVEDAGRQHRYPLLRPPQPPTARKNIVDKLNTLKKKHRDSHNHTGGGISSTSRGYRLVITRGQDMN